jgi:hypothetical protein
MPFPTLLGLSTYGRYVRVGESDSWMLIDSETGATYADAVAAPTEQFLIFMHGQPDMVNDSGTEQARCTPPLRDTCTVDLDIAHVESVFSYQMNLIGIVACDPDRSACDVTGESWHPAIGQTHYSGGSYIDGFMSDIRQITYDLQYNQPAILVGDYRIYFYFYSDYYALDPYYLPYLDIVDLEQQVDSPIQSIEWGQPVFFDVYRLSTTEYLPR